MAITALHAAASGLRALSTQIDVVSNNLANAETTAFKASRVNFQDLVYQEFSNSFRHRQRPGRRVPPSGIFVGLGTRVDNTQIDLTQGSMQSTNRPLDVAIQGEGFFAIKVMPGFGNGIGWATHATGSFFVNNKSELVLGIGDGYRLSPPITIPTGVSSNSISIGSDGTVQVASGNGTKRTIGQLQITQFVNPQGLQLLGGSIYQQTDASGPADYDDSGRPRAGLTQPGGFSSKSNVDPVTELVTLIKTQRAFEMNSQSIQTADQRCRRWRTCGTDNLLRSSDARHCKPEQLCTEMGTDARWACASECRWLSQSCCWHGRRRRFCTSGVSARRSCRRRKSISCRDRIAFVSGATLEIRGDATILGGDVKLRQICRWSDADKQTFAPVADLVITRVDVRHPSGSITIDQICSALRGAGVNKAVVRFAGPMTCTLTPSDGESDEQTALAQWAAPGDLRPIPLRQLRFPMRSPRSCCQSRHLAAATPGPLTTPG